MCTLGRHLALQTIRDDYTIRALEYTMESEYKVYEVDTRIGLAWTHLGTGNAAQARDQVAYARHIREQMGYHWGQVGANKVLAALGRDR